VTRDISYLVDADPEPGTVREIAPGVRWLRMPLPFRLDHVNLWLLEDGDGWTIVDTGLATDDNRAIWQRVFAETLGGRPVDRIILTHFHSDHSGLAGWIADRFGAELWMSDGEWQRSQVFHSARADEWMETVAGFFTLAGCPDDIVAATRRRWASIGDRVTPLPQRARRIAVGDIIEIGDFAWRVLIGRGHAPEHVSLYCAETGILIAGDQVLPLISPNVSVYPAQPDENPLADFLETIDKFRANLPDSVIVLPSHKLPFTGLHRRLDELSHHHDDRLARAWEACAAPSTAMEITRALFRPDLDSLQTSLAVSESLAHLNLLVSRGEVDRGERRDGVLEFLRT
jgi:glyoxylase-like metal-dependent hydrolase (beta-lactamase superfamily II)